MLDQEPEEDYNQDYVSITDEILQGVPDAQGGDEEDWYSAYLRESDAIAVSSEFDPVEPDLLDEEIARHERMIEEAQEARKRLDKMAADLDRTIAETAAAAASEAREKVRRERKNRSFEEKEPEKEVETTAEPVRTVRERHGKSRRWFR